MWNRISALVRKEFLALLKDKRSRLVVFVPPVIQLLVFGYAATYDLKNVPYAVYDEDGSALSRELLEGFRGSKNFREVATIHHNLEISDWVDSRKVLLVVHVGPRFTRDLLSGRPGSVQVIIDGRNSNTAMLALNYSRSIVNQFNQEFIASRSLTRPMAQVESRYWFNPNVESRWFFVPGIVGLLTLVVTILVTALTVAREREQGTFDQLLVTPMRPGDILLGKGIPGFLIGFTEATVVTLVGVLWFDIPLRGSVLTLYAGLVLFLLSAIGIGLMISSIAVTQQQGLLGAFLFLVPAIILSGFATPIANMPELIQHLTLLNPMRYFLVIIRGVFLEGATLWVLIPQFWPMAVIGVVNLTIAGWLFRHRMY